MTGGYRLAVIERGDAEVVRDGSPVGYISAWARHTWSAFDDAGRRLGGNHRTRRLAVAAVIEADRARTKQEE